MSVPLSYEIWVWGAVLRECLTCDVQGSGPVCAYQVALAVPSA